MIITVDDHKIEVPQEGIKHLSSAQITVPVLSPVTGMQVGEIRISFDTAVVDESKD